MLTDSADERSAATGSIRVLVIDDEQFVRTSLVGMLTALGYQATSAANAGAASRALEDFDPHVVLCDLELGDGPSGVDVIRHIERTCPWVASIVLSSHRSPLLVDPTATDLSPDTITLTKNDLSSPDQLHDAISAAVGGDRYAIDPNNAPVLVSAEQADVLRLVASGMDNKAIAAARGTQVRAVERMLERTYRVLGIPESESPQSARVLATRHYRTSAIDVS